MKGYLKKLLMRDIIRIIHDIKELEATYHGASANLNGHKTRIAHYREYIKRNEKYLRDLDKIDFGEYE